MVFDESEQTSQIPEGKNAVHTKQQLISPLPFDVQLQNTFFIEIVARRFPRNMEEVPHIKIHLEDAQVEAQNRQAQITLSVQVMFEEEHPPFEISFKLLGQFDYTQKYTEKDVHTFLMQGSLSILLPFARECLVSLCTRLQIPPMMLALAQIAPPPALNNASHEESEETN